MALMKETKAGKGWLVGSDHTVNHEFLRDLFLPPSPGHSPGTEAQIKSTGATLKHLHHLLLIPHLTSGWVSLPTTHWCTLSQVCSVILMSLNPMDLFHPHLGSYLSVRLRSPLLSFWNISHPHGSSSSCYSFSISLPCYLLYPSHHQRFLLLRTPS